MSAAEVEPDRPRLYHVTPADMRDGAWNVLAPIFAKACEESRGEFTLARIVANLEHWPIFAILRDDKVQAVMACAVVQLDGRRVLDCLIGGGDHAKEWPAVDDQFDDYARAFGCASVRIPCARKGWVKTLPHWKIRGYVLEREV